MPFNIRNAVKNGEVKPKRKLGQCFLTDANVAEKIVEAAELTPGDRAIEIGPGVCALTELLCARAGSVSAVEIDKNLAGLISGTMSRYKNFDLVIDDILKVPIRRLMQETGDNPDRPAPAGLSYPSESAAIPAGQIKLIANLPYYITTPILERVINEFTFVNKAVLMMQKEASDRLLAKPSTPEYGMLAVLANTFFKLKKIFIVPPHCFTPQPGVESAVILFDALQPRLSADRKFYVSVVKAAFAVRRKTLENSLLHSGLVPSREQAAAILEEAGIARGARGESLGINEFWELARALRAGSK